MKFACRIFSVVKAEQKTCRNIRSFGNGVDRRRRQVKYRCLDNMKSELYTSRINGVLINGKINSSWQNSSEGWFSLDWHYVMLLFFAPSFPHACFSCCHLCNSTSCCFPSLQNFLGRGGKHKTIKVANRLFCHTSPCCVSHPLSELVQRLLYIFGV